MPAWQRPDCKPEASSVGCISDENRDRLRVQDPATMAQRTDREFARETDVRWNGVPLPVKVPIGLGPDRYSFR